MQVMILHEDKVLRGVLAATLRSKGLDVQAFHAVPPAKEVARQRILDLLVMSERIGGRLAHDLALLAEWRNPDLGLLLLSDREGEAREDLFGLLPSLREVMPVGTDARTLARRILAAAREQERARASLALRCHSLPESGEDLDGPDRRPDHVPPSIADYPWPAGESPLESPTRGEDSAPVEVRPPLALVARRSFVTAAARSRTGPSAPEASGAVFLRAAALRRPAATPARRLHLA